MENVFYKEDSEYPKLLRKTKGAPKQLYYKGNWHKEIFKNCLAVVGSRRLTSYGQRIVQDLVEELARAGLTIVSGFMYGGDAMAHQAALNGGGQTIAVMPCGIERIHPAYQKKLYEEILTKQGLIISEYQGDSQPALWTYPQRNRIVAGLSKAVLVIEAGDKSGSLITANYAKKFKRKIFAVPGPITSSVSKGTNLLIKEGAEMVLSVKDILKYYALRKQISKSLPLHLAQTQRFKNLFSSQEKKIIDVLQKEPLGIDELSRQLEISVSELGTKLSLMQIKRLISQTGNKYYVN